MLYYILPQKPGKATTVTMKTSLKNDSVLTNDYQTPETEVIQFSIEKSIMSDPGAEIDPGEGFGD